MAKQLSPKGYMSIINPASSGDGLDIQGGKKFLAHWLANRRLQLAENAGGSVEGAMAASDQNKNLWSVPAYGSVSGMNDGYNRDYVVPLSAKALSGSDSSSKVSGFMANQHKNVLGAANDIMSVPGTYGAYVSDNIGQRLAVASASPIDSHQSVMVHELAHSMEAKPQESKISDIMKGAKITGGSNSYLESPTEIHSRLMQVRHDLGLDPRKNYTADDLKELRKNDRKYEILDRYDDNTILRLLNEVASVSGPDTGVRNS